MNGAQGIGDLDQDAARLLHRERTARELGVQRSSSDQLHDDERGPRRQLLETEDVRDVRMHDRRHRARFAAEALLPLRIRRPLLGETLEGARLTGRDVDGRPDDAEAALSDGALESPFVRDDEPGRELHLDDFEHLPGIVPYPPSQYAGPRAQGHVRRFTSSCR